jgi:hypothetical protein
LRLHAPRAFWKGWLKLDATSCPVRLYAATTKVNRITFHETKPDTVDRIQQAPTRPGNRARSAQEGDPHDEQKAASFSTPHRQSAPSAAYRVERARSIILAEEPNK